MKNFAVKTYYRGKNAIAIAGYTVFLIPKIVLWDLIIKNMLYKPILPSLKDINHIRKGIVNVINVENGLNPMRYRGFYQSESPNEANQKIIIKNLKDDIEYSDSTQYQITDMRDKKYTTLENYGREDDAFIVLDNAFFTFLKISLFTFKIGQTHVMSVAGSVVAFPFSHAYNVVCGMLDGIQESATSCKEYGVFLKETLSNFSGKGKQTIERNIDQSSDTNISKKSSIPNPYNKTNSKYKDSLIASSYEVESTNSIGGNNERYYYDVNEDNNFSRENGDNIQYNNMQTQNDGFNTESIVTIKNQTNEYNTEDFGNSQSSNSSSRRQSNSQENVHSRQVYVQK